MILALLLILCGPNTSSVTRVDLIERNHVINARGNESFCQYIFWDEHHGAIHVAAYKLHDKDVMILQHDKLTHILWNDGKTARQVISRNYRETRTAYDPERLDAKVLPEAERLGL